MLHVAELNIMVCHWSMSDPFQYRLNKVHFSMTKLLYIFNGESMTIYNSVTISMKWPSNFTYLFWALLVLCQQRFVVVDYCQLLWFACYEVVILIQHSFHKSSMILYNYSTKPYLHTFCRCNGCIVRCVVNYCIFCSYQPVYNNINVLWGWKI